ncbi:MAG: RecT protein [Steroidobacteraceae bacterium]|nr:RecT protein [Steroidobacteraceae bacterium]
MSQIAVIDEVRGALTKMTPEFKKALPPHVSVEKFQRVVMTSLQSNPDLLKSDRRTLFMACTRAAQVGLLPDGREGAIVSFGNQAQFMPMVAGIMKLVRNSGEISTWSVQAVFENDSFDYELGDSERIVHKPAMRDRGALVGAYSIVTLKDGEKSREFMNVDEIEAIRKRSRSGNGGPWKTDYSEMAKKTVVRRHAKRLPMSTDLDGALHEDDELFMPPTEQPAAPAQEAPTAPAGSKRPSRLSKIAEAAPAPDEDGVIDMPASDAEPEQEDESPI